MTGSQTPAANEGEARQTSLGIPEPVALRRGRFLTACSTSRSEGSWQSLKLANGVAGGSSWAANSEAVCSKAASIAPKCCPRMACCSSKLPAIVPSACRRTSSGPKGLKTRLEAGLKKRKPAKSATPRRDPQHRRPCRGGADVARTYTKFLRPGGMQRAASEGICPRQTPKQCVRMLRRSLKSR